MIKCGELSSRHYIKITRLQQVHSVSSFKSVISREATAPVGCTGDFVTVTETLRGSLRVGVGSRRVGGSLTPGCLQQAAYTSILSGLKWGGGALRNLKLEVECLQINCFQWCSSDLDVRRQAE